MTTVVVEGSGTAADAPSAADQPIATPASAEAVSEAAVAIAAIEADASVEREQIRADTELAAIAARHDAELATLRTELDQWTMRATTAEASNIELRALLSTLEASEPTEQPPPSTEPSPPPGPVAADPTPANPVDHAEPPKEPVRKKPRFRWI